MLQKTQAVRALQDGCSRLGLPNSTAAALLQFLSVKRIHDQFVPEKDRQLHMSPAATLDKLWHYMLLNTAVSCVHALLGGVVDHRGTDAWDLADDTKLLQRLYALNVLRLEGHEPDVELWTEPGTSLHTVHLMTGAVLALSSLPGGGRLYVTPSLTLQQQGQLVRALVALYAHGTQPLLPSMRVAQPGPAADAPAAAAAAAAAAPAAPAAAAVKATAAAAAAGCGTEPAAKRPRVLQTSQQHLLQRQEQEMRDRELRAAANKLKIYVQTQEGVEACFIVKRNASLGKVFKAYLEQVSLEMKNVRFCFDGEGLSENDTPEGVGMDDENIIDCIIYQVGC